MSQIIDLGKGAGGMGDKTLEGIVGVKLADLVFDSTDCNHLWFSFMILINQLTQKFMLHGIFYNNNDVCKY